MNNINNTKRDQKMVYPLFKKLGVMETKWQNHRVQLF